MIEPGTIIFFSSLLACIPLGSHYKQVQDLEKKRNFGTGIGILIATAICGPHIFLTFFFVWGNIVAIKYCNKRSVHQISLLFTWSFLLYLHFYANCSKYCIWLFQNLALRLVGLAFEVHIHDKNCNDGKNPCAAIYSDVGPKSSDILSVKNIISYAYFFLGLHKGPYYTWKTFNEHFQSRVSVEGQFHTITLVKMERAILMSLAYFLIRMKYPISLYEQSEFYMYYGADYRFICCMPQLVLYMIEYQMLLLISASACTEAGFGVYPTKSLPEPAIGPTVPVAERGDQWEDEYNFSMLKSFNNEKLIMGPKMKDTMSGWDMPTRYWFSHYIANNFLKSNTEVRSACAFLLWMIWAGPTTQNLIVAMTLWMYIHLEAEYGELYAKSLRAPWDVGFTIMRLLCLFYLTPCFIVDDPVTVLRYYNSIYWMFHIVLGVLTVVSISLQKCDGLTFENLNLAPKLGFILRYRESDTGSAKSKTGPSTSV